MGFGRIRAAAGWVLAAVALALPLVDVLPRVAFDAGEESALSGTGAGVVLLALAIGLLYERERECEACALAATTVGASSREAVRHAWRLSSVVVIFAGILLLEARATWLCPEACGSEEIALFVVAPLALACGVAFFVLGAVRLFKVAALRAEVARAACEGTLGESEAVPALSRRGKSVVDVAGMAAGAAMTVLSVLCLAIGSSDGAGPLVVAAVMGVLNFFCSWYEWRKGCGLGVLHLPFVLSSLSVDALLLLLLVVIAW